MLVRIERFPVMTGDRYHLRAIRTGARYRPGSPVMRLLGPLELLALAADEGIDGHVVEEALREAADNPTL